jgi:hypothetical protein
MMIRMLKLSSLGLSCGLLLLGCQTDREDQGPETHTARQSLKKVASTDQQPVQKTAAQPQPLAHRLLLLSIEGDTAVVTAQRTVDSSLNAHPRRVGHKAWSFDALDGRGIVLHQDNLPQPGLVRGEFTNTERGSNSPPDHVEAHLDGPHHVEIRVPLQTKVVKFYAGVLHHRESPLLLSVNVEGEVEQ